MRIKMFQMVLILASVFFTSQCSSSSAVSSQTQPTQTPPVNENVTVTVGSNTRAVRGTLAAEPEDEGYIDGKSSEKVITDLNPETILSHPAPEMWFIFPCQRNESAQGNECIDGKIKREFSPKLKKMVAEQWRDSMGFAYKDLLKKFTKPQELMNAEAVFFNEADDFIKKVQNVIVEAPLGSRNISNKEAEEIMTFLAKSSRETIQTAKENLKR